MTSVWPTPWSPCVRAEAEFGSGAPLVVAHVPFEALSDPESELVGELSVAG